jgi:hypothetical protein
MVIMGWLPLAVSLMALAWNSVSTSARLRLNVLPVVRPVNYPAAMPAGVYGGCLAMAHGNVRRDWRET